MKRNKVLSKVLPVTLVTSLCIANLGGCALLPVEDTGRAVPTVAARQEEEYNMVVVTRTDIVNSKTIVCNYTEKSGTDLSFETGGKAFGAIYVSNGDTVVKGQLLAKLNMGSLDSDIENLEIAIRNHEKELAQSLELMDLEIAKVNTKYNHGMITLSQRDAEIATIKESYSYSNTYLEEALYLEKLEYDTLIIKQQKARIYAPMDGIITYVSSEFRNASNTSVSGRRMITVSEASDCVFQASTDYRGLFTDGETITITMTKGGTGTYEATIEFDPDNDKLMYVYPTEEIADLEIGARATFNITVDSRTNVLAVATGAIMTTATKERYVYYINEDGIRDIKFIETGISGGGMTEVLSGLEYGETIIKD